MALSDGGWYAVDLDGVLAEYNGWPADGSIGKPIPETVAMVKRWIAEGKDVRIFTARVWPTLTMEAEQPENAKRLRHAAIQAGEIARWSREVLGVYLQTTCIKDPFMIWLLDDRATGMEPNTGRPLSELPKELHVDNSEECK